MAKQIIHSLITVLTGRVVAVGQCSESKLASDGLVITIWGAWGDRGSNDQRRKMSEEARESRPARRGPSPAAEA